MQRFRLGELFTAIALAIGTYWAIQLYPLVARTGPAPGVGGQWVFAFLPTVGVATLVAYGGAGLAVDALLQDQSLRTPLRLTAGAAASFVAAVFTAYWVTVVL